MSRTDKDAPYWVRAEFYEPVHDWICPDRVPRPWQFYPRSSHSCTLPPEPVVVNMTWPRRYGRAVTDAPSCYWTAAGWDRKYHTRPPRRIDRRIYFHGPNRRAVRDFCRKAGQEFRGTGAVMIIEPYPKPCQLDWWD